MKVGDLLRDRITQLKRDRLIFIAHPKYWYRLNNTEEQLEFNKKLYYDLVTIPSWRGRGRSAKNKQDHTAL